MKLCILSDSHGNEHLVEAILMHEQPDMALFLGDGIRDILYTAERLGIPYFALAGNCDIMASAPHERLLILDQKRILMTHGHAYRVKDGLSRLKEYAAQQRAHIVLYGHTHLAYAEWYDGCLYLCPGSADRRGSSYALLTLQDGAVRYDFHTME